MLTSIRRFFKNDPPPKEWKKPGYVLTVYMKKNKPNQFDMRYKNSRIFVSTSRKPPFDKIMQRIATLLGCPNNKNWTLHWTNYLNPIKQLKYRMTGIWYL